MSNYTFYVIIAFINVQVTNIIVCELLCEFRWSQLNKRSLNRDLSHRLTVTSTLFWIFLNIRGQATNEKSYLLRLIKNRDIAIRVSPQNRSFLHKRFSIKNFETGTPLTQKWKAPIQTRGWKQFWWREQFQKYHADKVQKLVRR